MQTALQDTPYFGSVTVSLERSKDGDSPPVDADGRVSAPVLVHVRERAPYQVSLGAGYSTNTGARVEANYRSGDLFGRAWELHTGVRIEQLRQTAYADVFFPPDDRRRRDGVGMAFQSSDIENLALESFSVGATRVQQRGSVEQRLGLNWQEEKQTPKGSPTTTNQALTCLLYTSSRRCFCRNDSAGAGEAVGPGQRGRFHRLARCTRAGTNARGDRRFCRRLSLPCLLYTSRCV